QRARGLGQSLGLNTISQTKLATAVSEIARNAYVYAGGGRTHFCLEPWGRQCALVVEIIDQGPGMPDLPGVLSGRVKSGRGMGLGIVGCQRILTDVQIESEPGKGTKVRLVQALDRPFPSQSELEKLSRQLVRDWKATSPAEALAQQNIELLETLEHLRKEQAKLAAANAEREAQKESAERLAEQLRQVVDSVPEIMFVVDSQLQLVGSNASGEAFFRDHLFSAPVGEAVLLKIREHLTSGDGYYPNSMDDVLLHRVREQEFHYLPRISVLGEGQGATVILHDVTEMYLLDKVRSDMLGTASHELKTPVTSAQLALRMLNESPGPHFTDEQRQLLSVATSEMDKLLRTIHLFLDVIRFQESKGGLNRTPIHPRDLLEQAVDESAPALQPTRQRVEIACPQDLPMIRVELKRMIYALTNLISNALKYSPSDAPVTVSVEHIDGEVRFHVQDRGKGIPPEYHHRIFERFFRVPGERRPGTGLGLSIVADFVRMNGGEVSLDSVPGEGSCFHICLPSDDQSQPRNPATNVVGS
ncbi:MAG: ATP-binding protein, partial [Opitutales bacterium]